jgi:TolB protein
MEPAIDGNLVVWADSRNGNHDIYGYDLAKGVEFPIYVGPGDQYFPAVSGNLVVWESDLNGNVNIYGTYVPEPATLALVAMGAVAAMLRRKR